LTSAFAIFFVIVLLGNVETIITGFIGNDKLPRLKNFL